AADDLSLTVDYAALAGRLTEIIAGEPVALIETLAQRLGAAGLAHERGGERVALIEALAQRLAAACLANERVQHAEITVHKPDAPVGVPVRDVSVTIRRSRT